MVKVLIAMTEEQSRLSRILEKLGKSLYQG
jgi:hypothetical protein